MSADMPIMREPELLAPAGDDECLRAAVANGADAVYFGLEDFNARRRAANFTLARLPEVMGYLHDRNVRGYVAFNTLIFSEELERAAGFVAGIAEAGADAVIVQDLGLLKLIRSMAPTLPIHASTQMTQTHAAGIELLGGMGVRRVILAREMGCLLRSTTRCFRPV
jgi:putative protease